MSESLVNDWFEGGTLVRDLKIKVVEETTMLVYDCSQKPFHCN
jgi:hypothetical protein